jgi:hypothetical protein
MEQKSEKDWIIQISAGSVGTVVAAQNAAVLAGAKGTQQIDVADLHAKIIWLGPDTSLLALLELLSQAGYISEEDWRLAASHMHHHFQRPGREIKAHSIQTTKGDIDYEDRRLKIMNEIHEKLLNALETLERTDSTPPL